MNCLKMSVVCRAYQRWCISLLLAAQEAENPESKGHEAIVQAICDSHLEAAEACIRSKKLRDDVSQLIRDECHHLSILLKATQVRPSQQIIASR